MSTRANHGGISLSTAVLSESSNTSLWPLLYSSVLSQAPGLYMDGGFVGQSLQTTHGAEKMSNIGSPISPLILQQSSPSSNSHSCLHQTLDQHCSSDAYIWTDNSDQNRYLHCQGLLNHPHPSFFEDMCYNNPVNILQSSSSFESLSSNSHDSLQACGLESHPIQLVQQYGSNDSQVLVEPILQELETALMGPDCDNPDIVVSISGLQTGNENGEPSYTLDTTCRKSLYPPTFEEQEYLRSDFFQYPVYQLQHMKTSAPSIDNLSISEKEKLLSPQSYDLLPNVLPFQTSLQGVGRGSAVAELLVVCAEAIGKNNLDLADAVMARLKQVVSIYGAPIERLAAYMAEGLVARIASSGMGIYKSLKCKEAPDTNLLSVVQKMYEICPYFKFGYMAANGAIAEAFKDETKVHIIDFQIAFGTQWISLIRALASRPGGPPSVRITGVCEPEPGSAVNVGLGIVEQRLKDLAKAVGVPFEFHPVLVSMMEVQAWMFTLRPEEALVVNFTYQLHHVPDESVYVSNPRDRLLQMVRSMNPKVLTLVEQEANTNTASFIPRFLETMNYYFAVFESIDVALPRDSKDRINVEQQCLAREIVNSIACESAERVERHELLGKWRARVMMSGFKSHPLNSCVNSTIKALFELYNEGFRLKEERGALFLGWLDRPLVVASAWH